MQITELTSGSAGLDEIEKFLDKNYHEGYTLSIYDMMEESTAEIDCEFKDMVEVIMLVSHAEQDYPAWIGVNELSESYVVAMNFTRGRITTPSWYIFKDGKLVPKRLTN